LGNHRLMDCNNHPDTTLAEVHGLLDTAQARLEKRLRPVAARRHGCVDSKMVRP
jgi:hypothetical protein